MRSRLMSPKLRPLNSPERVTRPAASASAAHAGSANVDDGCT